jgi:hypothetical protein
MITPKLLQEKASIVEELPSTNYYYEITVHATLKNYYKDNFQNYRWKFTIDKVLEVINSIK